MKRATGHLKPCGEECVYNLDKCSYGGWNSIGKCFKDVEKEQLAKKAKPRPKVKKNKDIYDFQEVYERWWLGKKCQLSSGVVKEISSVQLSGPPSFVYGCVILHFTDGSSDPVSCVDAFRPRKSDVIIIE